MFKVALKSLLSHKLRMLLTVVSIVLGVSYISGTYIFTDGISKTFNNLFEDVFEGVDVTVRPAEDETEDQIYDHKGGTTTLPNFIGESPYISKSYSRTCCG